MNSPEALSGAYEVHPAPAAPPSTAKLDSIKIAAGTASQNEAMLSRGNAMSSAPIWSGMSRLPKTPTRSGMIAKKIMMVPCIVTSEL